MNERSNSTDQVLAASILRGATRRAAASQVLLTTPPVGVRLWELPLAYALGALVGGFLYAGGQPIAVCLATGIGIVGAAMGIAASAETRRLAKRLAAIELLQAEHKNAA
jgi:hypothetical protein